MIITFDGVSVGERVSVTCYQCGKVEQSQPVYEDEGLLVAPNPANWGLLWCRVRGVLQHEPICFACVKQQGNWWEGHTMGAEPPAHAEAFVAREVHVHAAPERNERMGLHGRNGFRVYYAGGMSVWLPDDTFASAFAPRSNL